MDYAQSRSKTSLFFVILCTGIAFDARTHRIRNQACVTVGFQVFCALGGCGFPLLCSAGRKILFHYECEPKLGEHTQVSRFFSQ